jgi:ribosomal-protein-alanine N-acetyltransferase
MPEPIEIREMTRQDLDEVLEIEAQSFPTPWSRVLFERELSTPFARAFVAEDGQKKGVLGYLCFWLVDGEAHILNLAVHPRRRNRGVGTLLLGEGVRYCREKGVEVITLEVRRSNYKAISLYRNFHFQARGIRRRYYTDSGEDAVVMGLNLGESTSLPTV